MESYRAQKLFPMNGPVEIRCCAIDDPTVIDCPGAQTPALAATAPRLDKPEWDTLIWTNVLTFTGTPDEYRFYRDLSSGPCRHSMAPGPRRGRSGRSCGRSPNRGLDRSDHPVGHDSRPCIAPGRPADGSGPGPSGGWTRSIPPGVLERLLGPAVALSSHRSLLLRQPAAQLDVDLGADDRLQLRRRANRSPGVRPRRPTSPRCSTTPSSRPRRPSRAASSAARSRPRVVRACLPVDLDGQLPAHRRLPIDR